MQQTSEQLDKPIRDYSRLTQAEIGLLLKLHENGKSQVEIAQTLGCSQPTVSKWLNEFCDTRELAKHTARKGAQKLVERVIAEADVDQSLEVLDRLDVLTKKERNSGGQSQVNIVIGMPGQPAGNDPFTSVVSLSPVPRNELGE